jgi:hypothetical protein
MKALSVILFAYLPPDKGRERNRHKQREEGKDGMLETKLA